jgi:hypothetical protein
LSTQSIKGLQESSGCQIRDRRREACRPLARPSDCAHLYGLMLGLEKRLQCEVAGLGSLLIATENVQGRTMA